MRKLQPNCSNLSFQRVPYIPSDFDFSTESESYDQVVVRPHHGNTTTYIAHTDHPKKRKGKESSV